MVCESVGEMVDGELDFTGVSDLRDVSVLKRDVNSSSSEEGVVDLGLHERVRWNVLFLSLRE